MSNRCADPTFGIKAPALAILQLLAGQDPTFADWDEQLRRYEVLIQTFPWYNGRERGACLVLRQHLASKECLFVVFGEDRRSNSLFVEQWEGPPPFNCPTLENRDTKVGDQAYENRASFSEGEVGKATDFIVKAMGDFYAKGASQ